MQEEKSIFTLAVLHAETNHFYTLSDTKALNLMHFVRPCPIAIQEPVVKRVKSAIQWINSIGFCSNYRMDSDLSTGWHQLVEGNNHSPLLTMIALSNL